MLFKGLGAESAPGGRTVKSGKAEVIPFRKKRCDCRGDLIGSRCRTAHHKSISLPKSSQNCPDNAIAIYFFSTAVTSKMQGFSPRHLHGSKLGSDEQVKICVLHTKTIANISVGEAAQINVNAIEDIIKKSEL